MFSLSNPVEVSYKWFDHGVMLPIEGDRAPLPAKVAPGASVNLTVKGTAPQTGQQLVLKITLVQEAVARFMSKGAPTLDIPVALKKQPRSGLHESNAANVGMRSIAFGQPGGGRMIISATETFKLPTLSNAGLVQHELCQ